MVTRLAGRAGRGRATRIVAMLLALAMTAAACGGDDDDGGGEEGADEPAGEPQPGGKLVVGLEAETDGMDPTTANWAASAFAYAGAIFDPLTIRNADDEYVPYLAESVEPNDDYTVWTITVREGISFHDGTPLDADAVLRNLEGHIASPLTGAAIVNIDTVEKVDDLSVDVTMKTPWVAFPVYLAGQIGHVAAPSMLDSEDGALNPVGTGPFVFEEWVPGQRFVASKNADYWRADEGLPYLDEIEFRPITEAQSRVSALQSGEIDVLHTSDAEAITQLRDMGDEALLAELTSGPTEEGLLMFNTAAPPFDNVHARMAVTQAVDRDRLNETINLGVTELASGPFSGQDEYPVPEFPAFDPDAVADELEAYEEDTGEELTFDYTTTNIATNLQAAELLQDMWADAGIDVDIVPVEQAELIDNALVGDYQLTVWRQFGAADPDAEYVWWSIENAAPLGSLALNFSRFANEDVQAALDEGRQNPDAEARSEAYGSISEVFAEEVPFLFLWRTLWVQASGSDVGGAGTAADLPNGDEGAPPLGGWILSVRLYRTAG
jgi:ABC-type transport system substrate-binding protein